MPNNAMILQEPPPPSVKPPPCAVVLKHLRAVTPKSLQMEIFPKISTKTTNIDFLNSLLKKSEKLS